MTVRNGTRQGEGPYDPLTVRVYDSVYAWKDYAAEARRIHALVKKYGRPSSRSLLDVACGTGSHLRFLARWYETMGVDVNAEMLTFARRKLPRVRFVRGRMQTFRIPQRFDVITCLFSAIGYVRSARELRRTLTNLAHHLNPGGVLIVEPFLTTGTYRTGSVHLGTYGTKGFPIARMNTSERHGSRAVMDMHYLVPDRNKVRHWVERHDLALFSVRTYLAAFRHAGFRVRLLPSKFSTRRGLYVAVKQQTIEPTPTPRR